MYRSSFDPLYELWTHVNVSLYNDGVWFHVFQAAGKLELEESNSGIDPKPDPTGEEP